MRKTLFGIFLACSASAAFAATDEAVRRIDESAKVIQEIMYAPDKGIPREIFENAKCIAVIPGAKRIGFIVGVKYGKGVMTCRDSKSKSGWTGPSTVRVEGGSFGAQIGGGETDIVLMVMNQKGADRLMKSEFTLGGDAAAMAGPVGRSVSAQTDAYMTAEILTYSRSRGIFAGAVLTGATLRADDDDNAKIYGRKVDHQDILMGKIAPPASARPLYSALNKVPVDKDTDTTRTRAK